MREQHVFRPQLSEILEPRAVPSMAGVTVATGIHGISVTLPPQVSPANPQVQAAFKAFDQDYIRAVDTLLLAQGTNDLIVTASNQATFNASITAAIDELAEQIVLSLGTPSTTTATTGSTTSTSTSTPVGANQVVSAIVGGTNSLEGQLEALSLAEAEAAAEVPLTLASSSGSNSTPVPNVVNTAEQVRVPVRVPVAEAVGTASASANLSTASSPAAPPAKAADDVRSAFNNFLGDYFKAVQGTLLAAGSSGQANPQANRAAFDAKVNQSIRSLETTLTAALGRYPATSGLGPRVQSTLGGDGAASLKGQLAKLATPQGAQATVVRDFTLGSTKAIAQALAAISADVAKFLGPAAGN